MVDVSQPGPQPNPKSIGDQLLDAGWRQGVLFRAQSVAFLWNELDNRTEDEEGTGITYSVRQPEPDDVLVVTTQDCDIASPQEDYVEALLCRTEPDKSKLDSYEKNSARFFVVDRQRHLVAQAMYRVHLSKKALLAISPDPWPDNSPDGSNLSYGERRDRFVRWLARRYDRPAFPDAFNKAIDKTLKRSLDTYFRSHIETEAAFNRTVSEIRVTTPKGYPRETDEPPYDTYVYFLLRRDPPPGTEEMEAVAEIEELIRNCFDDAIRLQDLLLVTPESMYLAEYFDTRPLYLDDLTYRKADMGEGELPRLSPYRPL